jgi:hypothetical protein
MAEITVMRVPVTRPGPGHPKNLGPERAECHALPSFLPLEG